MKQIFVTVLVDVDETMQVNVVKNYVADAVGFYKRTYPVGGIGDYRILKAGRHKEPRRLKQQKPDGIPWD